MNKKALYGLLAIIVLVAGVGTGLILVQQQQDIAPRATTPDGIATIRLDPSTQLDLAVGDTFSVDVPFSTSGIAISSITALIQYQYDTTLSQPPIAVQDVRPNQDLIQEYQWSFKKADSTIEGDTVSINIIALDPTPEGYTASGETNLATIDFVVRSEGSVALSFDTTESRIAAKATAEDQLAPPPNPAGTYTSSGGDGGDSSTTPTPQPTSADTGTNPTSAPTNTPVAGSGTTTTLNITSPTSGSSVTDTTPTITGTAPANTSVSIRVTGATTTSATVTANSLGSWSWTPTTPLSGGSHTVTATAGTSTDTTTFTVTTTTGSTTMPESGVFETTLLVLLMGSVLIGSGFILSIKS